MKDIPERKVGDRVRVMQVADMEKYGLANLRGTVMAIVEESEQSGQRCIVEFDRKDFPCAIVVWSCSLSGA